MEEHQVYEYSLLHQERETSHLPRRQTKKLTWLSRG